MQLILLAAGRGSRLPERFRQKPKCLVEIKNKSILEYNSRFFKYFKNKLIITGYKSDKLKRFIKKNNFKEIKNYNFDKTNMVYSAFRCNKHINSDVVICYSDIIFDFRIYKYLKLQRSLILLKKNWLSVWSGRMGIRNIKKDAVDVVVKKNEIITIGKKIKNKLPKYQFMGIIKLKSVDYFKLYKFFKKLKNKKIDFTSFINLAIENKTVKFNAKLTKKKWFEIDNFKDVKFTEKNIW